MTILLLPLLAAGVVSVDAPISAVTVYSDRARVVRTGVAPPAPSGTGRRIALPLLPDSADPATIRLEARASELQRVDVARVDEDDFPADEAARLLAKLEALDDRIARARGETQAATTLVEALRRLAPIPPASEPLKPPRRLDAGGWPA